MSKASVTVRDEILELPTYRPDAPDKNPMFLEKRVYQGSSGKVYPLPFIDRVAEKPTLHPWRSITLQNEFLEIQILPEIGGRIHRLRDKTNGYDAIYYQPVIKPALVALAGPWISGGIEFNWPQHHRPSTFMPAGVEIEKGSDGSVTVWLSEHDPMCRMKGMHGVRLRPGRSVLELLARVYNRTADVQTFLWWANVATEVHDRYQSFFPSDATFVADHAKRAMSTFPLCPGHYYGVDYARRAAEGVAPGDLPGQFCPDGSYPANDLSWYANIPVPTSYMCMGTREAFFGGYDHRAGAGIIHVANPHISPGKKQWTWGNHEFGYAWDRLLSDPDADGVCRPYIELMAGVYTDNQPDFSYLQPGETKSWTQRWYPIRSIGPADQANEDLAVSLKVQNRQAHVGIHATALFPSAVISLSAKGKPLACWTRDLSPAAPVRETVRLSRAAAAQDLELRIEAGGRLLMAFRPKPPCAPPSPETLEQLAATEPPPPSGIASADELYLTGLHLEQYRHATRCPIPYWQEALRRDPGDARCNLALGRWHLRRGEFTEAERHLSACIARWTFRNPNPADGEAYYQLGRLLALLGHTDEAYASLYKATWNVAWSAPAHHALAEMDGQRGDWETGLTHLDRCLERGTDNLRARALKAHALLKLGRKRDADLLVRDALRIDPLDPWLRHFAGKPWRGDNGVRLDVAFDLARAGLDAEAIALLHQADPRATDGSLPMVHYTLAWLHGRSGDLRAARASREQARAQCPDYCFPSRLEEMEVLKAAVAEDRNDARAHLFLGHLLYDRRRHTEAIAHWKTSARLEHSNPVVWRCLGIASFNVLAQPAAARRAFAMARAAAPDDARLLFEADQLAKRLGDKPARRLRALERHSGLVRRRDDLTIELCALYNQTDQPLKAKKLLASRNFQPWEGGEGLALGQHVRCHLLLARESLASSDTASAIASLEEALRAPTSLGEAKHLLANQSDIHFWLGEAFSAAGSHEEARRAWQRAASFRGDFQQMSVRAFSEMTYFSAMSMKRLGDASGAEQMFRDLLAYASALEKAVAKIDYFATSLPTMLLFDEDIQARQTITARFQQAQACLGLGRITRARRLLEEVLSLDPNHAMAADFLPLVRVKNIP